MQSSYQYSTSLPQLDTQLSSDPTNYCFLAVSCHCFMLLVPILSNDAPVATSMGGMSAWKRPSRHASRVFALKTSHDGSPVSAELNILKRLDGSDCIHVPELVWTPSPDVKQLGVVPVGCPINF
jgi:hypothetical protein